MTLPIDKEDNVFLNMSRLPKWVRRIIHEIYFHDNRATFSYYPYHRIIDPSQVSPRFISIAEQNAWDSLEQEVKMETTFEALPEEPRPITEDRTSEASQPDLFRELDELFADVERNELSSWEGDSLDDFFRGFG